MKLSLLAVGHSPPAWVAAGCAEYIKRMPRELPLSIIRIKPEACGTKTREQRLVAEKNRLRPLLQGFSRVIVLDERGTDMTTLQLAQRLESWWREGGNTAFVIGGADGIDGEIKTCADAMLRLSSLTLPHALAQLLLCEQLYRAVSVLRHAPYHRED